jgi:thioredoxin-related protein
MKKIISLLFLISLSVSAASNDGLSDARSLAEKNIIVNQSATSPAY